jgi:hypothetical protein
LEDASGSTAVLFQRQLSALSSEVLAVGFMSSFASRFAKRAARSLSSELRMPVS